MLVMVGSQDAKSTCIHLQKCNCMIVKDTNLPKLSLSTVSLITMFLQMESGGFSERLFLLKERGVSL